MWIEVCTTRAATVATASDPSAAREARGRGRQDDRAEDRQFSMQLACARVARR